MSSSQEWTSLREFARCCGRRHRAAQKAIEDGRIPASAVKRDARGHIVGIEIHEARRAWMQNTDPSRCSVPLTAFRAPRPGAERSAPRPVPSAADLTPVPGAARPAPELDALTEEIGRILGVVFANALIPACAMAVARQQVEPHVALNVLEDFLLVTLFAAADVLGLNPDDDRPAVLFRGDLEATLYPDRRGELLNRIRSNADQYIADEKAAADEAQR